MSAQPAGNPAEEYVRRAHQMLVARQTIQAEIHELVSFSEPAFHMTGTYAAAGMKSRLSYAATLNGGAKGTLLEVCDGERLWSVTELPASKRVTRRDVRLILAAMETAKTRPERAPAVDLALGGLPALLASLQRSMQFDALKEETVAGRDWVIVQGRWKPETAQRLKGGASGDKLPPQIPDLVRLYFARETQFPERVLYLKKFEDQKTHRPLIDLQFRTVQLDAPLDPKLFEFTPPENVEPEDVTRQYLDQLFPPDSAGKEKPAAAK